MSDRIYLVCPLWPGRDPFADIRQVNCSKCPAQVSITAANLPALKADKAAVICEDCWERMCAELDPTEYEHRGVNLPSSGIHHRREN